MTWKFIYTYRERCKTGPAHNRCWNWSPFTSKHTWMRFSKFWKIFFQICLGPLARESPCSCFDWNIYRVILSPEAPNKFGKSIPEFGETHSSVFGSERRPVSALILSRSCFADISGTESNNIWELKLMNFRVTVRWKISEFYRGISDLKNGYQPTTNIVKDEKGDWLPTPTVFWLGGGTISLSFSMYKTLVVLGRQRYIQQNL